MKLPCSSLRAVTPLAVTSRQVLGVVLFNISLRMLHTKKQAPLGRPFVKGLQYVLRETGIGPMFFGSVAKVPPRLFEDLSVIRESRHAALRLLTTLFLPTPQYMYI